MKMRYTIVKTEEYEDWLAKETMKSRFQIAKRLEKIETEGHFGTIREDLGEGVCELKWVGGRRIYYAHIPEANILLLLGGNKNGQNQDITQAKKILKKYIENET
jgi:putative addiction module killer protein